MSTRGPRKPMIKPAPRPQRRERVAQPIPSRARGWDWKPECEEVVGPPGNRLEDVLARCTARGGK
jgi:hypothetical protein